MKGRRRALKAATAPRRLACRSSPVHRQCVHCLLLCLVCVICACPCVCSLSVRMFVSVCVLPLGRFGCERVVCFCSVCCAWVLFPRRPRDREMVGCGRPGAARGMRAQRLAWSLSCGGFTRVPLYFKGVWWARAFMSWLKYNFTERSARECARTSCMVVQL